MGWKVCYELMPQPGPEVAGWQQRRRRTKDSFRMYSGEPPGPGNGLEVAGKEERRRMVQFVQRIGSKIGRGEIWCSSDHVTFDLSMN